MAVYQTYFTGQNSLYIDIWEPDGVDAGKSFTLIGNKPTGEGFYLLLKIPAGLPENVTVNSAILRMPEMNFEGYRGATALDAKFSRITGAWTTSTKWSTVPAYDTVTYDTHTFNEAAPSSSNYDYRTGYHPKQYKYYERNYYTEAITGTYYYSLYYGTNTGMNGGSYPYQRDGVWYYQTYVSTISAYYDTYIKYRNIDISNVIQDTIDSGGEGVIVWYDLPGPNDSRKYFKTTTTSDENMQFLLTVDYVALPAPTDPTIPTIGTVTTSPKTFDWSDSTDESGHFASSELYYEMQISTNNGSTWSSTYTSAEGSSQYALDLKSYLSLETLQYYYNTQCKIKVRAKTPAYESTNYYSDWVESAAFTIDYRLTPSAPTVSPSDADPYEGQTITFTCGRPTTYNTHDSAGSASQLTYYVCLASGTVLASATEAATSATKDISYTVGNLTSGDDLDTTIYTYCVDADSQTGASSSAVDFDVLRFQKPTLSIGEISRTETGATVPITIEDTGYGGTQSNSQIVKVQYDIGSGYVDASLGAWSGLNNSFSISGLSAGTQYSISVRAVNDAPSGLSDLTGDPASDIVLAFLPALYVYKDSVTGKAGIGVKSLFVHSSDFGVDVDEGSIAIENAICDENGNEVIQTPATSSAVNEITVTNAATGNAPEISATGDDTNIDLVIAAKGTGKVRAATNINYALAYYNSGAYYAVGYKQWMSTYVKTSLSGTSMTVSFPLPSGFFSEKPVGVICQSATGGVAFGSYNRDHASNSATEMYVVLRTSDGSTLPSSERFSIIAFGI